MQRNNTAACLDHQKNSWVMTQQNSVAWVFCDGCKCTGNSDCISTWKDRAAIISWLSVIRCTGVTRRCWWRRYSMAVIQSHHRDFSVPKCLSVCRRSWALLQIHCSKVGFEWNGRSILQSALPRRIPNPWQIQSRKVDVYSCYTVCRQCDLKHSSFVGTSLFFYTETHLNSYTCNHILGRCPPWLSQTVALKFILLVR